MSRDLEKLKSDECRDWIWRVSVEKEKEERESSLEDEGRDAQTRADRWGHTCSPFSFSLFSPNHLLCSPISQNQNFPSNSPTRLPLSSTNSMSTASKDDDNLALSSEDSSSPDESDLELGLGLSLSHHHHHHAPYARIFTAKDFPSSPSSSSSLSSFTRSNVPAGTKRPAADSLVATDRPSQVVGWPPLRASRMNSFNGHAKSTEALNTEAKNSKSKNAVVRQSDDNGNDNKSINIKEKRHLGRSPFVKVNMDGTPIGRKVDLSLHSSYETLAQTLEEMFNESTTGITCKGSNGEERGIKIGEKRHSKLLDGSSKYVLTYEDKEGDWMLVGDVPWRMFVNSVKRLRIMRTSEANGLAPRPEGKNNKKKSMPI